MTYDYGYFKIKGQIESNNLGGSEFKNIEPKKPKKSNNLPNAGKYIGQIISSDELYSYMDVPANGASPSLQK